MFLKSLSLLNFKNYAQAEFQFINSVNCIAGLNGEGKTNVLDAVYYLSFTKSFFNSVDSQNIKHEEPFFLIQGVFSDNNSKDHEVSCGQKRNQKKSFKINKKEYTRLADHIGLFPCVMVSPADADLIYNGSEERRKFIDSIISQYNKVYLDTLINYNKALLQRNALLKQSQESGRLDPASLEIWNEQLISFGKYIYNVRKEFVAELTQLFRKHYSYISDQKEQVEIYYESPLHSSSFDQLLENTLRKDKALGYTTGGVHKDDLVFKINNFSIRKFGSQGQQKSLLIALRLSQFDLLHHYTGIKPLLLLDDISDKLDEVRLKRLMELVSTNKFGQIFITDTGEERLLNLFSEIKVETKMFTVHKGLITVSGHVEA